VKRYFFLLGWIDVMGGWGGWLVGWLVGLNE